METRCGCSGPIFWFVSFFFFSVRLITFSSLLCNYLYKMCNVHYFFQLAYYENRLFEKFSSLSQLFSYFNTEITLLRKGRGYSLLKVYQHNLHSHEIAQSSFSLLYCVSGSLFNCLFSLLVNMTTSSALTRFSWLIKHGQYLISLVLFLWLMEIFSSLVLKDFYARLCRTIVWWSEHIFPVGFFLHSACCMIVWLSYASSLSLQAK